MKYDKKKVTIIIPAKDEGKGLKRILNSIQKYANEIIVVDGHSKDNTKSITLDFGAKYILDNGVGRGDGVRLGIKSATKDYILFFDADGSHEADDVPLMMEPLFKDEADLVVGSRKKGGSYDIKLDFPGWMRLCGTDFMVALVNYRFGSDITELLYSFRAIKRSVAKKINLKSDGFEIEQEMVVACLKRNYRVVEIASREKLRGWGKSKLRTIAGFKLLFNLIRILYF